MTEQLRLIRVILAEYTVKTCICRPHNDSLSCPVCIFSGVGISKTTQDCVNVVRELLSWNHLSTGRSMMLCSILQPLLRLSDLYVLSSVFMAAICDRLPPHQYMIGDTSHLAPQLQTRLSCQTAFFSLQCRYIAWGVICVFCRLAGGGCATRCWHFLSRFCSTNVSQPYSLWLEVLEVDAYSLVDSSCPVPDLVPCHRPG